MQTSFQLWWWWLVIYLSFLCQRCLLNLILVRKIYFSLIKEVNWVQQFSSDLCASRIRLMQKIECNIKLKPLHPVSKLKKAVWRRIMIRTMKAIFKIMTYGIWTVTSKKIASVWNLYTLLIFLIYFFYIFQYLFYIILLTKKS
jgi:hypothetical protein